MPLIDSRQGVAFAEINPDKLQCQYTFCQAIGKHKACARCKYARYCSVECQRSDWKNHKKVCRSGFGTPIMDAAVWRDTHKDLFQWAAVHALQAHWDPDYIHTHGLLIQVFFGDRLHGASATPSHFEVGRVNALSLEEIWPARAFYNSMDLEECKRIQDGGGLGLALAVFQFVAAGNMMISPCVHMVERYALTESRDPDCTRVASRMQLENTVKGHINNVALPGMLERPAAIERPLMSGVGQVVLPSCTYF